MTKSKRVLIVDDSPSIRQQLRVCLRAAGYLVDEAVSGEEGLQAAERSPFDLIITDVNMGALDGLGMIERVRRVPGHTQTPIFVLTTEWTRPVVSRGREVGATAWIVKPFKIESLVAAVDKAVNRVEIRAPAR